MNSKAGLCEFLFGIIDSTCPGKYKRTVVLPDPVVLGEMSQAEVGRTMVGIPENIWKRLDRKYKNVSKESFEEFLNIDEVSEMEYEGEWNDCDDLQIHLASAAKKWCPGIAVGIVYIEKHAINCAVLDGIFYFVEPQDDVISLKLQDGKTVKNIIL